MSSALFFNKNTNPDEFQLIRLLGCGGYGQVVELVHIPTNKHLAGKLYRTAVMTPELSKLISKEIDIMKSFQSPYTVNYYGTIKYPKKNPRTMVLMDYCDRGSVRDLMDFRETTLNEQQIAFILHDLLEALSMLHDSEKKIIHRDIKAANILISSDSSVKLTDFGVSRQFINEHTIQTKSTIGTTYWMAPEVINGRPYSYSADIWSTGATAVELIEGAPPYFEFQGYRAMVEISTMGFQGFRKDSEISPELQDFVFKCMEFSPDKRPQAKELLEHPFITQISNLNRAEVFKDLLKSEIDFNELLEDEDIQEMNDMIQFEIKPEFHPETNISEKKKTLNTFVTPIQEGDQPKEVYVREAKMPTLKPEPHKQADMKMFIIIGIVLLLLVLFFKH